MTRSRYTSLTSTLAGVLLLPPLALLRRDADPWAPIVAFVPSREEDAEPLKQFVAEQHMSAIVA